MALAIQLERRKHNNVTLAAIFYDPLGFVSPVIVQLNLFFQLLCKAGISWDQPFSGELLEKWWKITMALMADPILVERCYFTEIERESDVMKFRKQGFCGTSTTAYTAVL